MSTTLRLLSIAATSCLSWSIETSSKLTVITSKENNWKTGQGFLHVDIWAYANELCRINDEIQSLLLITLPCCCLYPDPGHPISIRASFNSTRWKSAMFLQDGDTLAKMSVIDATSILAASTSKLQANGNRSTSVEREIDPSYDLAFLAVLDPNGIDEQAYAWAMSRYKLHHMADFCMH